MTTEFIRPNEIRFLTPLRGIAALFVALFHAVARLDLHETVGGHTGILSRGYIWVDLFFLLSGFVLAHVYADRFTTSFTLKSCVSFLKLRFARVYPLHLFVLITYIIMVSGVSVSISDWSIFDTPGKSIYAIATNLLLVHSMGIHEQLTWNGPSWSISTEWHAYILFPFIVMVCNRAWKQIGLFLGASGILIALYLWHGDLDITYDYGFFRCISEFSIGIVINRIAYRGRWLQSSRPWYVLTTIMLLIIVLNLDDSQVGDIWIIPLFAVLILALSLYEGQMLAPFESRAMVWLGNISYSFYMTHAIILGIVSRIADVAIPEYTTSTIQRIIFLIAYILVVLTVSSVTFVIIEKPARNFIRDGFKVSWQRRWWLRKPYETQ